MYGDPRGGFLVPGSRPGIRIRRDQIPLCRRSGRHDRQLLANPSILSDIEVVGIEYAHDWHALPGHDLDVGDPLLAGKAIGVEGQNVPQGGGVELKRGKGCEESAGPA